MISKYRFAGDLCRIFYSMSESEEKDQYEAEQFRQLGFNDVEW
jgi:hypothetical protein